MEPAPGGQRAIHVAFGACTITVASAAPEVLHALERSLRHLLAPPHARPDERLEVDRCDDGYRLRAGSCIVAESASDGGIVHHTRTAIVRRVIDAHPALLWLHAGAAAWNDEAVLCVAPSGQGKSTVVTGLHARGWRFLADDVVALEPASWRVVPFPQTPAVRESPNREMPPEWVGRVVKREIALDPALVCATAVPCRAVTFPAYRAGAAAALGRCPPATAALALLQNCLNLAAHRELGGRHVSELVRRVPAYHVAFGDGAGAAECIARALGASGASGRRSVDDAGLEPMETGRGPTVEYPRDRLPTRHSPAIEQ